MRIVIIKSTSERDARLQLEMHLESLVQSTKTGSISYGKVERLRVSETENSFLTIIRITRNKLSGIKDDRIWLEVRYDSTASSVSKPAGKQKSKPSEGS